MIGAEAHVCVLQTALDLRAAGKEVYLVADAVSSRSPRDVELALERMRADGVRIVSREMVTFEWLRQAGTDRFREISRDFTLSKNSVGIAGVAAKAAPRKMLAQPAQVSAMTRSHSPLSHAVPVSPFGSAR